MIKGLFWVLALLVVLFVPAVPVCSSGDGDPVVEFPDPGLEAAIRDALGNPSEPVYQSDLLSIIDLDASEHAISDLSVLQYCTSLFYLQLRKNLIADVSPLSSLTYLTILDLGDNQISDLSPLTGLSGLTTLYLDSNQISNISGLENLTGLSILSLGNNKISEILSLSALTGLSLLLLDHNNITDISPLADNSGFDAGDNIYLVYNYLDLAAGSANMAYIESLAIRGVEIDYTPQNQSVVKISVALQGAARSDEGWIIPLTVLFFAPGATSNPLATRELNTFKDGGAAITEAAGILPGTYDITVVSPYCLTNLKKNVVINQVLTEINMGTLLEGDAHADENSIINILDFGILTEAYGTGQGDAGYDGRADFDRNGRINIADFGLLALNYGKRGPIEIK